MGFGRSEGTISQARRALRAPPASSSKRSCSVRSYETVGRTDRSAHYGDRRDAPAPPNLTDLKVRPTKTVA